ncbi:hypothetical protein BT67DRAFT_389786 [Trichocladium antarcticum]|uniref:Uncharacterized protein n=1 Tax=Trichocladium antarcticum TaxID=1450529 RepID=A0AAN6ZB20_9PEZI|nr:hypothetical protein BT67DRAFT_389786 [Trichocladium antarcticum]
MENGFGGNAYAMGPRVPLVKARDTMGTITSSLGFRVPSPVLARRAAATTEDCTDARLCEKPVGSMTIPIALGVGIPVVLAIGVLLFLHRRNVKKQRQEDLHDPHKSLDFGLDPTGTAKGSRKSLLGREKDPNSRFNRQQMSMDMNLSSPYLLPPDAQNSRESLNSLAKTLKQTEDPYRQVAQYATSDVGSIRSVPRAQDAQSGYPRANSRQENGPYNSPPRQNSLPKSPLMPEPSHMRAQQPLPEDLVMPFNAPKGPLPTPPLVQTTASISPHDEFMATGAPIQELPAVAQKAGLKPLPSPIQPSPADSGVAMGYADIGNPFEKPEAQELESPMDPTTIGLGVTTHAEPSRGSIRTSTSSSTGRSMSPAAQHKGKPGPAAAPTIAEPMDHYDFDFAQMPRAPRSPSPPGRGRQLDVDEPRGRNMQRTSHLYDQPNDEAAGLGVPHQDNRRLSIGFRPLPPDEIMESEDPEYRANRIRSFYKEYFEDTKPEDRPAMPAMPRQYQQHHQGQHHQQQSAQYYEDYDASYQGQDAPYFDPASNSFVMPYAQPVSRRAMTPPPTGQRFPGPRGPPRAFHGSQAGMRLPPNVRGPPRPGSSVSNQLSGPSRPGSSVSGAYGRARAGSAMSGSRLGPRKPIPPPADLATLPTPSKLRDDSFAIFNAMDFAPPETYADRTRGRSQSPAGERRPYKVNVPAVSPLVNAFEELPSLPSPHLLHKSNTFTALDFAPPRKFVESDNRSDAGSIRSNRSGLSTVQANAIRAGAGRVSRLPGDQVFTQAALSGTLKPQWTMRD